MWRTLLRRLSGERNRKNRNPLAATAGDAARRCLKDHERALAICCRAEILSVYCPTRSVTPTPYNQNSEFIKLMNRARTADEIKEDYIEHMGGPLGKLFHALWQEIAWLHWKWEEYVQLFGTSPSRIELLNSAAPRFFGIVNDSLWEGTLLHISRLTDPQKTSGKDNLTLRRLPALVDDPDLRETVSNLVRIAVQKSEFCRDWRNRHIAHRDLDRAIEEDIIPLHSASRAKVKDALRSIAAVMDAITLYYENSTTKFDVGGYAGGAESLLYVLDDGLTAEAMRRDRLQRGEYTEEDIKPRSL